MPLLDAILRIALLPGALVAAAAGLARIACPRSERARGFLLGAGLAAGFVLGLAAVGVRPDLPLAASDAAWSWVAWFAVAGALLGAAEAWRPPPAAAALVVRLLAGGGATWLVLSPLVPHAMTSATRFASVTVGAVLVAGLWTVLVAAVRRGARVALAGPVLVALATTSAVLLLYGHAAVMAQAGAALACAVGTAVALRWARGGSLLPAQAAPVVALVLVGLVTGAWGYLNHGSALRFPPVSGILLVLASATPVVRRASLATGLSLVLAGAASWAAAAHDVPGPSPW